MQLNNDYLFLKELIDVIFVEYLRCYLCFNAFVVLNNLISNMKPTIKWALIPLT